MEKLFNAIYKVVMERELGTGKYIPMYVNGELCELIKR